MPVRAMVPEMQYGSGGYGQPDYYGQQPQQEISYGYGQSSYDDFDEGGYRGQQGPPRYYAPPDYNAPVVWSLHGFSGVSGFSGVTEKYCTLPYPLRYGDEWVLSRWNMMQPRTTVSRIQAIAQVFPDGTAILVSNGRGPTLWRARGGPWNPLYKGETKVLQDGDQVSLDCNDPEGAVFTCMQEQGGMQGGYNQGYAGAQQQGYGAQQQGYGGNGYGGGGGWGGQQGGYPPPGGRW